MNPPHPASLAHTEARLRMEETGRRISDRNLCNGAAWVARMESSFRGLTPIRFFDRLSIQEERAA